MDFLDVLRHRKLCRTLCRNRQQYLARVISTGASSSQPSSACCCYHFFLNFAKNYVSQFYLRSVTLLSSSLYFWWYLRVVTLVLYPRTACLWTTLGAKWIRIVANCLDAVICYKIRTPSRSLSDILKEHIRVPSTGTDHADAARPTNFECYVFDQRNTWSPFKVLCTAWEWPGDHATTCSGTAIHLIAVPLQLGELPFFFLYCKSLSLTFLVKYYEFSWSHSSSYNFYRCAL